MAGGGAGGTEGRRGLQVRMGDDALGKKFF